MIDASQIQDHMDVVCSYGQDVGTIDNVGIKLTKNDPVAHDQHHYLKLEMVKGIETGRVVLSIPGAEALNEMKAVEN